MAESTQPLILIGIGASAGGLAPLETIVKNLPKELHHCALIIAQHLDPSQPSSLLPEILTKHTSLPVTPAINGTLIQAGHLYVIEPNTTLTVQENRLHVSPLSRPRNTGSGVIDQLFNSIASNSRESSVAIILSGIGSDGTLGSESIHAVGGLIIAQDPATAIEKSMPSMIIEKGIVDHVLPPEKISEMILNQELEGLEPVPHGSLAHKSRSIEEQISGLWPFLKRHTGHDFSGHRQNSVIRRVLRRMEIHQIKSVSEYLEFLRSDPAEIQNLYQDLLIGVTEFFRDPDHFSRLESEVIPRVFDSKSNSTPIRIWVPGCATGEEAYSLAMILLEYRYRKRLNREIQIFATDLREEALEIARRGIYSETIRSSVADERIDRFFEYKNNHFRVTRELRECCIFSRHDLIRDPPFSRLDLISCRNLLIYLEPELQKKVLSLFHYGLHPEGYLFLGPSESISIAPELFRPIDSLHRIFQHKESVMNKIMPIYTVAEVERNHAFQAPPIRTPLSESPPIRKFFDQTILSEYATPAVLVDLNDNIVCTSGRVNRYLELPTGSLDIHVVNMTIRSLRADLRATLFRARNARESVTHHGAIADLGDKIQKLNLTVRPFFEFGPHSDFLLILFEPLEDLHEKTVDPLQNLNVNVQDAIHQHLEQELREIKERLQSTIEELEAANEELKSSNEELQSMNEELQSSNEELQTSKEELQSLNEELETVNQELKTKIAELDTTYSDLENLFESTQIATIFLDKEFRINRYTPAATDLFHLISSDIGRKLYHIRPKIWDVDLISEARRVQQTLERIEMPIKSTETGRQYVLRIHPYKTLSNVIDGTVITFLDVTELKRSQDQIARLAAIVEGSGDAIFGSSLENLITSWNLGAERLYGYTAEEVIGKPASLLIPHEKSQETEAILNRLKLGERVENLETTHLHRNGGMIYVSLTISPMHDDSGRIIGISRITRDITSQVLAEHGLRNSEERYRSLVSVLSAIVWTMDPKGHFNLPQASWTDYTGQDWYDQKASGWMNAIHPDDRLDFQPAWNQSLTSKSIFRFDGRIWNQKNSKFRHFSMSAVPLLSTEGSIRQWVATFIDIEDSISSQQSLKLAEERLTTALRATGVTIFNQDPKLRYTWILNSQHGCGGVEVLGKTETEILARSEDAEKLNQIKRSVLETGKSIRTEINIEINGKLHDFILAAQPQIGINGEITGITGAKLDITEQKILQRTLLEASRRKDHFLAVLGHELRNPLAAIRNASFLLRQKDLPESRTHQIHDILERQSHQLCRLIDDLLDISRIANRKIDLKMIPIDLAKIIGKISEDFQIELMESHPQFSVDLPKESVWIHGDPVRISQIITNLLSNAQKFTRSDDQICVTLNTTQNEAIFSIEDTGVGIDPSLLEKVFDPFIQADQSLDRGKGGLGLGLSLVKGFTELMDGQVSVMSEGSGKGAKFSIRFPLLKGDSLSSNTPHPTLSSHSLTPLSSPSKVLLIEDNLDAAESLKTAIELFGHTIEIAHTGLDGLKRAETFLPDIVICDIGLPDGLDGFAVAHQLRASSQLKNTKLIALSGYGQSEDKRKAKEAGFHLHLTKPIDLDTLQKILIEAITLEVVPGPASENF